MRSWVVFGEKVGVERAEATKPLRGGEVALGKRFTLSETFSFCNMFYPQQRHPMCSLANRQILHDQRNRMVRRTC